MSQDTLNTARPIERKLKIVGCDLDDVLANFIEKFIDMAIARFGVPTDRNIRPCDWSWSNMGWTKEQEAALWQQLHDTPNFWTDLGIQPGVDPALVARLCERTRVYFPTARAQSIGDDVAVQCARWLLNTFGIPFPTVIVGNEKGPLAAALKYDYFIDDRDKNCLDIKAARPECQVFLANSGHNQKFDAEANGITRVSGFNEFARIVLAEA
jgi:5'(3')-deoxyribonucleotidase